MRAFCLALTLLASACAATSSTAKSQNNAVLLGDVLQEYRSLNARLERVAAPLLRANANLCPRTSRDIGITVHTISDYPPDLQVAARDLMGVGAGLSVRSVRAESTAGQAGLRVGDEILQVGPHNFKGLTDVQAYYASVNQAAFEGSQAHITIMRNGKIMTFEINPQTFCGYPVDVFFSDTLNGHTDGEQVFITSELLRQVPDDVNLALIVAHELSHAIAGHIDQTPTKSLELDADTMALTLMARAGYDIEKAVAYWKDAPHPYTKASGVHPGIRERYKNFIRAKTDIQTRQRIGLALTLSP